MTEHDGASSPESLVEIGRLSKPYGLRGEIKFYPVADEADWLLRMGDVCLYMARPGETPLAAPVSFIRPLSDCLLAVVEGVDSPETARKFAGSILYIQEKDRPELPEGEFYIDQLYGLTVIDSTGRELGKVKRAVESKTDTLLEIQGDNAQFLLPMAEGLIERIDLGQGEIRLAVSFE